MASFLKTLFGAKSASDSNKTDSAEKLEDVAELAYGEEKPTAVYTRTKSVQRLQPRPEDVFDICDLPEELFIYVLTWVPAKDVVKRCSLVCKYWLAVSRDCTLWRIKCERERKYIPSLMGPAPENFMIYYFKNPYTRNLLRNPYALEGLHYWVKPSGTTRPEVEDTPAGADPVQDHIPVKGPVKNWVTSYRYSSMSQSVDLLKEGCSEAVLDQMRPKIHTSVWCAARWDCGSRFIFKVQLLNKARKEVDKFETEKDMTPDDLRRTWHQLEHTFTNYPAGVRHVLVTMGGVDTQFWAGNYGSKFTCPSVQFVFDEK